MTKATLRRAIIRTAALTHWRHNLKSAAHPANDDGDGVFHEDHHV